MSEHTPITGELRELLTDVSWVEITDHMRLDHGAVLDGDWLDSWHAAVDHACDAIDAVHAGLERENAELRERLAVLDNERENMHDGWGRLPVDADGVPIRVGDVMDGTCPSGKHVNGTVNAIGDGVFWISNVQFSLKPDYMHHYHAPTVEDVLREMHAELDEVTALYVGEAIDSDERDRDEARIFAEYAAKLRLAGSDAE